VFVIIVASGSRYRMWLPVIVASTVDRPVAEWFLSAARAHGKFSVDLVDLKEARRPRWARGAPGPRGRQSAVRVESHGGGAFTAGPAQESAAVTLLDEAARWTDALKVLRS
jgi:hypothetical protein